MRRSEKSYLIESAYGKEIRSNLVGDIKLYSLENKYFLIKDVIFCPQVKVNLLSVNYFLKKGSTVEFKESKGILIYKKEKIIFNFCNNIGNFYL